MQTGAEAPEAAHAGPKWVAAEPASTPAPCPNAWLMPPPTPSAIPSFEGQQATRRAKRTRVPTSQTSGPGISC